MAPGSTVASAVGMKEVEQRQMQAKCAPHLIPPTGSFGARQRPFSLVKRTHLDELNRLSRSSGGRSAKYAHSQPLWVEAPPSLKAPQRMPLVLPGQAADAGGGDDDGNTAHDSNSRLLRDFRTLAAASQRANNIEAEGNAYYCASPLPLAAIHFVLACRSIFTCCALLFSRRREVSADTPLNAGSAPPQVCR